MSTQDINLATVYCNMLHHVVLNFYLFFKFLCVVLQVRFYIIIIIIIITYLL